MISYASNRAAPSPMAVTPAVSKQLIGPDGDQVLGMVGDDDSGQAPGHGQAIDDMLRNHEDRLSALESPGPVDGESEPGE